jgi:hypothetical protein
MKTGTNCFDSGRLRAVGLLALLAMLLLGSCHQAPEYKQGARILYYPRSNAYFDQDNAVYILFDTVEQQWKRQANLVEEARANLGPSVPVEGPSVPVYKDNVRHRLLYGTALYADDSQLARKRREDSIRNVPPIPEAPPPAVPEPRRKTKVGRFLEKIFGRKNKE